MRLMRLLALLLLPCVAGASPYYEKTTTSPVQYVPCANESTGATDTALLTKAAALGGGIVLQANCTINAAITLVSNTLFNGNGYTITAAAAANWSGSTIRHAFTSDNTTNITIENTNFVWTGASGSIHIIDFNVGNSELQVLNNTSTGAGDLVAYIGSTDVTTIGNKAYNCSNACFDHWNGTGYTIETNNVASLVNTATSAICYLYTGFNTNDSAGTATTNYDVAHNICYINGQAGSGQLGIWIQGYASCTGPAADDYNIVADNEITVASGIWGEAIRVTGCANNVDIHDNIIRSDGTTTASLPAIEANGPSTGVSIHNNLVYNWKGQTSGSDRGVFTNKGTNGELLFNNCLGTCSSPLDFVNTSTTIQQIGDDTGTGSINTASSFYVGAGNELGWVGRGILTSPGPQYINFGGAPSATPLDQIVTTQSARGSTDTDTGGANLIIASGAGTGAGAVSTINFSTPNVTSSGTALQSYGGRLMLSQGVAEVASGSTIDWAGRGIFTSPASGQIQLGNADAASPANQTLMTQNSRGGTDTNVAGGNLTIQSGLGTGNAAGSSLTLKTPNVGSTGTAQETAVNAFTATNAAISIGNATSNPTFTLLGSGTLSGTPLTNLFASPPSIGSGTPGAGAFTTLSSSSGMALSSLATQATNTVVGNATSGSAAPTALAVGTCSTAASALNWTTNTGFGCNTAITAATLNDTGTGADLMAAGTTAQRPGGPTNGQCRYNSTFAYEECYNNSKWRPIGGVAVIPGCSSGASVTHTGDQTETNLAVCTVPAAMVCSNCGIRITEYASRSASGTNTVNYTVRWSASSGDTSGGMVLENWNNLTSAAVGQNCQVLAFNANATGSQVAIGTSQATCNFSGAAIGSAGTGSLDTTAATYINFNCKDTTSSSDTCGYKSWVVELLSP